ncbi:hypothetical protein Tco_1148227, partial [Tanacetum coccineum]
DLLGTSLSKVLLLLWVRLRGLCPYLYTNGVLEAKECLCLILGHVEQLKNDQERLEDESSRLESSMEVLEGL